MRGECTRNTNPVSAPHELVDKTGSAGLFGYGRFRLIHQLQRLLLSQLH